MTCTRVLHQLLDVSASRFPDNIAIEEAEGGSLCYSDLAHLSDRLRDRLRDMGVGVGDLAGICMRKSDDAVASIFRIMKDGSAYFTTEMTGPPSHSVCICHI